ncbi:hypothetical protein C0580_00635 [Candidatus Parcubacteria bacterium]|nr:MAG: hypothetical protein C0580_00635 [Candidatus Parcubacteria bacterium]
MIKNKKFVVLGIFFLLWGNIAGAFQQDYTPKDTAVRYQTYLDMINIGPSWSNDLELNKEVVIAVLDSGMDMDHPDLLASLWVNNGEIAGDGIDNDGNSYIDDINGWDFLDSDNSPHPNFEDDFDYAAVNHGTVIAGVIAASHNDSGIVGIAPQAKIMPLRVLNEQGSGNTLVLSQAIEYAIENGADIINFSLVGQYYDELLQESIKKAYDKGIMIVAASGNEENKGISLDIDPHYPVCDIDGINRVFGVAALDKDKKLADFSNYGEVCIDISAPGEDFYSTTYYEDSENSLKTYYKGGWNGTSVAAPTVSATMALIKMQYPDLRPYDIYNIIMASSQDISQENPLYYVDLGAGLLDVGAALNYADSYYNETIKIVLAPGRGLSPEILIMDTDGNVLETFLAYGIGFKGGVNVATGDVDGGGEQEIITAPMAGGGPHIRVFDKNGELLSQFFAYANDFYGGVNVATGDVDGDGEQEIITAPMAGGGPHIRVFDQHGNILSEFFAYEHSFSGGVNVATGDVNNDNKDEIVLAPMGSYEPRIRVYDQNGLSKSTFLAYDASMKNGVAVSVADINNDGWPEIVTAPGKYNAPDIKMFSYKGRVKHEFQAYSKYMTSGVDVVARDISGDNMAEILTLPHRGSSALFKSYDEYGVEKDSLYLRHTEDKNGYNFDILAR